MPAFTSDELSALRRACQGRSFAGRRDAAIIAVFLATGIRRSEMAGILYHCGVPGHTDLDLPAREVRVRGKGSKTRVVKIGYALPAPWTATSGPAPGTRRRAARSCG